MLVTCAQQSSMSPPQKLSLICLNFPVKQQSYDINYRCLLVRPENLWSEDGILLSTITFLTVLNNFSQHVYFTVTYVLVEVMY